MTLTFDARIVGDEIHCGIGSEISIAAPVFCFSLMVKPGVVSGGTLLRCYAGYAEVLLPDIPAGGVARLVLRHDREGFAVHNRAWLPAGGYLRTKAGCLTLPGLVQGVQGDMPPRVVAAFKGLPLVPQPTEWQPAGGTVQVDGFSGALSAPLLALATRLNLPLPGALPVTVETVSEMARDAYEIVIDRSCVKIRANAEAGVFSAWISLLTLLQTTAGALPLGRIVDAPRFGYRGQHLDCARHFYRVETILRLLDLMALLKLNRFHWHFADDEAFRIEVDCAPDLWRKTAFRGEHEMIPGVYGGGIRSGGSYSKADVARVLQRAQELHIEVVPEIEIPAHSHALIKAVPGLRDPGDIGEEVSVHGYLDNVINPAMPTTWDFLHPLMAEIAEMFPLRLLHLGCDEAPHGAWSGSPAVAALKKREGLQTADDVQGWMMARLAAHLAKQGIRSAAWEEAAKGSNGGIGHDALLFSWTGQGAGIDAARRGHDVVMCPAQHVYFDMAHTGDTGDWGAAWAAFVALEDVVAWQPVPKGAEDVAHRIVGVEGCFWSEFTTCDRQIEPMLAPRILGLANKAWDLRDRLDGTGLRALAQAYAPLFDQMGWQRHKAA